MFPQTTTGNFQSWERFLDAYYEPIRTALGLMPFVGPARADDLAQGFFLKLHERDFLAHRPEVSGPFRNLLYVAARRHAVDEWRKARRRPEASGAIEAQEPADPTPDRPESAAADADELYALSILHMTVARVRRHLIEGDKSDHWMIFDELVLAPLIPGRVGKTREEVLAMFPGQPPGFLDNRITTVKRVFRRILPALIPVDPTDGLSAEERLGEFLEILHTTRDSRLWLAFLTDPKPRPEESTGSSLELASGPAAEEAAGATACPDILHDELRVLLAFWLDMPLREYLDDLESVGPRVSALIHDTKPRSPHVPRRYTRPPLNLRALADKTDPRVAAIPAAELAAVLERLKLFAKRVHRAASRRAGPDAALPSARREDTMPAEVARVLYNLAGAVALDRCGVRLAGISDGQFRKNLARMLDQPWIDARLQPVFHAALRRLGRSECS
jgi:hypothetical protein